MDSEEFFWKQAYFKRFADIFKTRVSPLTIVVGSGSSREAGFPDWNGFVDGLIDLFANLHGTAIADAYNEESLKNLETVTDNWQKMSLIKSSLGNQYIHAVRALLKKENPIIPSSLDNLWKLNPNVFMTLNLDGLIHKSFASLKTGRDYNSETGKSIGGRYDNFSNQKQLIVELHGNIDDPKTWILTKEDIDELFLSDRYLNFVRSLFSRSLVLFYGVGIDDLSVGGHLSYLRDIDFNSGEFFVLGRRGESLIEGVGNYPVQPIFIPDDMSWNQSLELFSNIVSQYSPKDTDYGPVMRENSGDNDIPSPDSLISMSPNEIRLILDRLDKSLFFGDDGLFSYDKYKEFCDQYDSPIHLSTRLQPETKNNKWLNVNIEAEAGKGNFGRVYVGSVEDGSRVAVKIAHTEVRDNPIMLESFRRGVSSMGILTDDNVSGTVSLVKASELPPSIMMKFIEGVNFEEFVFQDGNSIDDLFKILVRVGEIVLSCHKHKIIVLHRDLRPANIMVSGDYWENVDPSNVFVLDFDLSWFKGATGSEYYMNSTQDLGYLAPEQLDRKSRYSTRSALVDVYGFGMLIYFALSRSHPSANASLGSDWWEKCISAGRRVYRSDYRSLSLRVSSLIYRMTNSNQDVRPHLISAISEISKIRDIINGEVVRDPNFVMIELLHHINKDYFSEGVEPSLNYHSFNTVGGSQISFKLTGERISASFSHTMSESVDRSKRAKILENANARAIEIVKTFGDVDMKNTGIGRGQYRISIEFDAPYDIKEFVLIRGKLDTLLSIINLN